MSTYLDKLIESVKADIDREHERVVTFRTRKSETQEVGTLKRLEQRLEVLEQLKDAEKNRSHVTPSGTRRSRGFRRNER